MTKSRYAAILIGSLSWALPAAAGDKTGPILPKPSADEPLAKAWSLPKAARLLETVSGGWLQQKRCVACHTGIPYLLSGTSLGQHGAAGVQQVRKFLEYRAANWDSGRPEDKLDAGAEGVTEVVATAAALAIHDAQTTGKLHPLTRKTLDRAWTVQRADGAWDWNQHQLPPLEYDLYFGAVFVALGVGMAPERYAEAPQAKAGMTRLRGYLAKTPLPNMHHRAWLLWAALHQEGLMSRDERQRTVQALLALQRQDGGWNLPSLGDWQRHDGRPNDKNAPSDGYATGLTVFILRQAGVSADDPAIKRGVAWLQSNQRTSGRWFTRSLSADRAHYISNAGTAFAVMALQQPR